MTKSQVLITGASGLIGTRIQELLSDQFELFSPDLDELDITDDESVKACFEKYRPQVVFHLAAFTNLNEAEKQKGDKEGSCYQVNVVGTENVVGAAKELNAKMIFISTDYVFSGKPDDPGPYKENHALEKDPNRLCWYGYTKVLGEQIVGQEAAIVRICNPVKKNRSGQDEKLDYVHKIVDLYEHNQLYPMFSDQFLSLTAIEDIVGVLSKIAQSSLSGVFHVSSTNLFTPFELASYLLKKVKGVDGVVKSAKLVDFLKTTDAPNRYIQFAGLSVEDTMERLVINFPSWKQVVDSLYS